MKPRQVVAMLLTALIGTASAPVVALATITAEARACFAAVEAPEDASQRDICERALRSKQLSAEALAVAFNNRGGAHLMLKDYDKAVRAFEKAIELDPADARPYNNLGQAFAAQGRHAEALRSYGAAIERDRRYAEAYLNRALSHRELGDLLAAQSDFLDAQQLSAKVWRDYLRRVSTTPPADRLELATGDIVRAAAAKPPAAIGSTVVSMLDYDASVAPKPVKAVARQAAVVPSRSLDEHEKALMRDPALVRAYQTALDKAGYKPGPIDGLYGPSTRAALEACLRDGAERILR